MISPAAPRSAHWKESDKIAVLKLPSAAFSSADDKDKEKPENYFWISRIFD